MTTKLVLSDQFSNIESEQEKFDLIIELESYLRHLISGFSDTSLEIDYLRAQDNRVQILIEGSEEIFVENFLKKELGSVTKFTELRIGDIRKGTMVDVGDVGFGIFTNCGIIRPQIDVLLPLYVLRTQLAQNKKVSTHKIIKSYDFISRFPIYVEITNIDNEHEEIQGKIAVKSLNLFKEFSNLDSQGLMILGKSKKTIEKSLYQTNHQRDIDQFESFGYLEHLLRLKTKTHAAGIISEIGYKLEGAKFSVLNPKKIKSILL